MTASRKSCCSPAAVRCRFASRAYESSQAEGSRRGSSACRPGNYSNNKRESEYREQVAARSVKARVSVEEASDLRLGALRRRPWPQIGMRLRRLGAAEGVAEEFGFTPDHVVAPPRNSRKSEVKYAHCGRFRSRGIRTEETVRKLLREVNHEVVDLGTHSTDPVDYPDYAEAVGRQPCASTRGARHRYLRQRRGGVNGREQSAGNPRRSVP